MIVVAKEDTELPEPWMRNPLAIQEIVAELTETGAQLRYRVEDPSGQPVLVEAFACDTIDAELPAHWSGSEGHERQVTFGPEAWQNPTFWADHAAGTPSALESYRAHRTPNP